MQRHISGASHSLRRTVHQLRHQGAKLRTVPVRTSNLLAQTLATVHLLLAALARSQSAASPGARHRRMSSIPRSDASTILPIVQLFSEPSEPSHRDGVMRPLNRETYKLGSIIPMEVFPICSHSCHDHELVLQPI